MASLPPLRLSSLLGRNGDERLALTWSGQFLEQRTEIWSLEHFEFSAPILGWISPWIRVAADECAYGFPVAEVDPLHRDDLVDDRRQFASGFPALDLRLP